MMAKFFRWLRFQLGITDLQVNTNHGFETIMTTQEELLTLITELSVKEDALLVVLEDVLDHLDDISELDGDELKAALEGLREKANAGYNKAVEVQAEVDPAE
jgi:hypothetical protein